MITFYEKLWCVSWDTLLLSHKRFCCLTKMWCIRSLCSKSRLSIARFTAGRQACWQLPWKDHRELLLKPSDISLSQSCFFPGLIASDSGMEYCDLGYSYFSKNRQLSSSSSRSVSGSLTSPGNTRAFSSIFSATSNSVSCNVGPPDPDVVEYLPPSAKNVSTVLAYDDLLIQKDINIRTALPLDSTPHPGLTNSLNQTPVMQKAAQ